MQQVKEWFEWFFNLQLPVVGTSVLTVCIFALVIFSKTSLGKKVYIKATTKVEELATSFKKHKEESDAKIKELKDFYEEKLQVINAKNEKLEKLLIAVSENINNKHIQELVETYTKESKEVLSIADIVDDAVIETKEQCVKEAQSVIDEFKAKLQSEYDSKAKELEEQIAKYKSLIDGVNENGKDSKITKE